MPELSVEESRRLARNFLVGKGSEAELEDTKRALESDPQLALELLEQIQSALDGIPPAGFTPDQWRDIDTRVAAQIEPLAKGGFSLGRFFARLFAPKPKSKDAAVRIKRKGSGAVPEESVAATQAPAPVEALTPSPESLAADGMEEMAPIAPVVSAPAAGVAISSAPALSAGSAGTEAGTPETATPAKKKKSPVAWIAAALLLLALLGAGGYYAKRWYAARQEAARLAALKAQPTPRPTPAPTAIPTPKGPPRRALPPSDPSDSLPVDLPHQTPQAAGEVKPLSGWDARDDQGRKGFPLP